MAIRFKRVQRLCDPTNKKAGKRVYPVVSYQYDTSATLDEFAKDISSTSGVSEGETISVLKDFRTLLRKTLLSGRSVNIKGLGYFFLAAQSKGTEKAEDFTVADISGLRICFRANSDIRLFTGTSTRSDGLKFKDLDHINESSILDGDSDGGSDTPAPDPDNGSGDNGEAPDPAA
ncbi:HU family DNA-binding protein [uncultured Bacteroides sp.]|uniref:HU family DNA-binding protein n=1 Tax=uncultured Bacteroides sp. TaxID=162156 RepID=UPI002677195F|nr:HU family DNA-binding protein [uncultured Bacteroides sp.]